MSISIPIGEKIDWLLVVSGLDSFIDSVHFSIMFGDNRIWPSLGESPPLGNACSRTFPIYSYFLWDVDTLQQSIVVVMSGRFDRRKFVHFNVALDKGLNEDCIHELFFEDTVCK